MLKRKLTQEDKENRVSIGMFFDKESNENPEIIIDCPQTCSMDLAVILDKSIVMFARKDGSYIEPRFSIINKSTFPKEYFEEK